MVGVPPARENEENRLADARSEFVASLPRRLDVLRAGLGQIAESPTDRERQNGILRRLHALASSARVLGFASVAEVLGEAERTLRKTPRGGTPAVTLKEVGRALDLLPSLVSGPVSPVPAGSLTFAGSEQASPLGILVFGPAGLASALAAETGTRFELEHTADPARAREFAQSSGPDAIVVDADQPGARELIEALRADPLVERAPIVGVGTFASAEAAAVFATAGADRILQKPVSPEILRRTLLELGELSARTRGVREPLGELSVEELADRIAAEVRKGLVDSLESSSQSSRVALGDGADVLGAVWGAVARVRELVTLRSTGNIRFQAVGPEGAIPLAPWINDDRRAGDRGAQPGRGGEEIALTGRRVVVADDDPGVVWFLSGLLKAVGAEVLEAHDGERALERVFESYPDLVISDVLMPRRDGFSLCHEIKRDVVARDVPVILLSWKEDLLQRVRELGGGADGYLRKEATASTVVERVREVLRPRARIEQRLKVGGEVRGRLDGVTPRLVLDLVAKLRPDSTVTIRDAVYLYEVHLRGGHLRSLTRSASDGSFDRGPLVLSALLGVNAGRFVVQADTTPCRSEFNASLPELFEVPVRRAREALAALAAERLPRVTRVRLELASMARYLECTPEPARKLVERMAAGASPGELLLTGQASAWLLEAVLSDLARRGAVLAVESRPAAEPEAEAGADLRGQTADSLPPGAVDSAWSEPPTAPELPPGPVAKTSSSAVSDASASAEPFAARELTHDFGEGPRTQSSALDAPADAAIAAAAQEPGWFGGQVDGSASREMPDVATRSVVEVAPPVPPERQPVEAAPAARSAPCRDPVATEHDKDIDAMFAEFSESPIDAPRAVEAPREVTPIGLGPAAPTRAAPVPREEPSRPDAARGPENQAERRTETPSRVGVRPVLRMPRGSEPPSPSMADVFAAALAESPPESVPIPPAAIPEPSPAAAVVTGEARPLTPLRGSGSKPRLPAVVDPRREPDDAAAPQAEAPFARLTGSNASAELPVTESRAEPERSESAPKTEPAAVAQEPSEPARTEPEPAPFEPTTAAPAGEVVPAPVRSVSAPNDSVKSRPVIEVAAAKADAPPRELLDSARIRAAAAAAPSTRTPSATAVREVRSKPSQSVTSKTTRGSSEKSAPPKKEGEPAGASRSDRGGEGYVRLIASGVIAFAGAFAVVHFAAPAFAPRESVEAEKAPALSVAAAPPQIVKAPEVLGPTLRTEPLAIPPGVDPGPSKGFIDVVGGPDDQLYVDGTFVGRGPSRSVPVTAGAHEVRIVRGDAAHTTTVTLAAGKRLRVRLDEPSRSGH